MADNIPDYACDPLKRCLDSILTLDRLLHLSMDGLQIISKRPKMSARLIELTMAAGREVTEELKVRLDSDTRDAEFANKEIDSGFPMLHAFTIVGYWTALESGIEDMILGVMCNEPKVLDVDVIAKIRIPLSKYEQLGKEERMRLVLSEVQRGEASGLTQGVNAFENVLNVFGLGGDVNESVGAALWKLNNFRNVIVHRNSRADRRFIDNCPSLNLKIGDHVTINHKLYGSFVDAVVDYILILIKRLMSRYDAPGPKWTIDL